MLGSGFKPERLRVNLRLAINRLKLLENKKTEMAQKARKEIADYLSSRKDERARIRVEHIIREDYLVEAMEILELYCDLLLARYGLIQSMRELDPGLAEAVSSLIWAAPRLQTEVSELKIVANQLCHKFSKEYGNLCRTNQIGTVSERLMHKLSVTAPPKILVEKYLIEIAKNYNVQFEPDSVIMGEAPNVTGFDHDDKKGGPGNGQGGDFNVLYPLPNKLIKSPAEGSYLAVKPGHSVKSNASVNRGNVPEKYDNLPLPKLPSVPVSPAECSPPSNSSEYEDIDFEDLSKRLSDLQKKT